MPAALAALLAARFADCPIGFHDICDLMDVDPEDVHIAFQEAGVSDLFQDTETDFKARSPILAEHLLAEILPGALVLEAIATLVERLVSFRAADHRFEESKAAVATTLERAKNTLVSARARRDLDDEEERVWRSLNR